MATRRTSYLGKPTYIYLNGGDLDPQRETNYSSLTPSDTQFDFDESELWNNTNTSNSNEIPFPSESKNPIPSSKKPARKSAADFTIDRRPRGSSMPLNIPDWSKILRQERRRESEDCGDEDDFDDDDGRIPPHEYLARTRRASSSVHQGSGRTLKGRDLSRVRNAIWKQTGFED